MTQINGSGTGPVSFFSKFMETARATLSQLTGTKKNEDMNCDQKPTETSKENAINEAIEKNFSQGGKTTMTSGICNIFQRSFGTSPEKMADKLNSGGELHEYRDDYNPDTKNADAVNKDDPGLKEMYKNAKANKAAFEGLSKLELKLAAKDSNDPTFRRVNEAINRNDGNNRTFTIREGLENVTYTYREFYQQIQNEMIRDALDKSGLK